MTMALSHQVLLTTCLILLTAHQCHQVDALTQPGSYVDSGAILRRHFPALVKDKLAGHLGHVVANVLPVAISASDAHQELDEVDDFEDPDMMDFREAPSKNKRQQYDDYGHLRFGKRDHTADDYGHMRFGKRDHTADDYGHMRFGKRELPAPSTNNNNNEEDYGHLRFGAAAN